MTRVKVRGYQDIFVSSFYAAGSEELYLEIGIDAVELHVSEARELVKALKKHIKKAEGN